jgi:hypothetical protein
VVPFAGYDMPLGYDDVGYGMFELLFLTYRTRDPTNVGKSR